MVEKSPSGAGAEGEKSTSDCGFAEVKLTSLAQGAPVVETRPLPCVASLQYTNAAGTVFDQGNVNPSKSALQRSIPSDANPLPDDIQSRQLAIWAPPEGGNPQTEAIVEDPRRATGTTSKPGRDIDWRSPYYLIIRVVSITPTGRHNPHYLLDKLDTPESRYYDIHDDAVHTPNPHYCMLTPPPMTPADSASAQEKRAPGEFRVDLYSSDGSPLAVRPDPQDRFVGKAPIPGVDPDGNAELLCSRRDEALFAIPITDSEIAGPLKTDEPAARHTFGVCLEANGHEPRCIQVKPSRYEVYTVLTVQMSCDDPKAGFCR